MPLADRLRRLAPALLGLLLLATFGPALLGDFVWDDRLLVLEHPPARGPGDLLAVFGRDLWATLPVDEPSGYYRPLMELDLLLDRALYGLHPWAWHLESLAWHALAVLLLAGLLRELGIRGPARWAALSLLAFHPAVVEPVVFASARNDLMAAVGLLAAARLLRRPGRGAQALGVLAVLGAALSKESAYLAPLLLPLLLALGPPREEAAPRARRAALAGALGVGLALGLRALAGVAPPARADAARLLEALLRAPAYFAEELLWPPALSPALSLAWDPVPWWALGLLLALAAGLWALGGRRALAGLLFAALALAPSLAGVASQGLLSARYLYLPLVGLSVALGAALQAHPLAPAFLLLAPGLAWLASRELPHWRDDLSLWSHALERTPNAYAHGGIAKVYEERGELRAAATHYTAAATARPPFPYACYNVSRAWLKLGEPEAATHAARAALEAGCAPSPELLAPYATALAALGRWSEAWEVARRIDRDPTGKAAVVRVAAGWALGHREALAEELARGRGDPRALREQAAWLLEQGGEPGLAAELRAAPIPGEADAAPPADQPANAPLPGEAASSPIPGEADAAPPPAEAPAPP